MSAASFKYGTIVLAVLVALSATPVGAIFGFFLGLVVAFFIAPVVLTLGSKSPGVPSPFDPNNIMMFIGALYVTYIVWTAYKAWDLWSQNLPDQARSVAFRALALIALALAAWLSSKSLMKAWP